MIDTEFAKQTSLDSVAQAVVDRVKRIHGDTFASGGERAKFCPRHEDMTLLVRNFGYPLGELSQPTPTPAPGMCAVPTVCRLGTPSWAGVGAERLRRWPCCLGWRGRGRPGFEYSDLGSLSSVCRLLLSVK